VWKEIAGSEMATRDRGDGALLDFSRTEIFGVNLHDNVSRFHVGCLLVHTRARPPKGMKSSITPFPVREITIPT